MADGAAALAARLHAEGRIDGVLGAAGPATRRSRPRRCGRCRSACRS